MKRKNVIKHVGMVVRNITARIVDLDGQIVKERAWAAVLEKRIADAKAPVVQFERQQKTLDAMLANADLLKVDELLKKVNWMHERIDLLANRLDEYEAYIAAVKTPGTLRDSVAFRRLKDTVGRFDERLLALEHPGPKSLPFAGPRRRKNSRTE